ncbi:MAG: riboflavin synthase subunit alpha [Motiliproteus sp.]
MFTGIVQGCAEVIAIESKQDFRSHTLRLDRSLLTGLKTGASVAHNGCCLTVTQIDDDQVRFDLMQATLALTNLGQLQPGDRVNVERAARFGDEIGGHSMSGHILCTASISSIIDSPNNRQVWFELPQQFSKYLFVKGYIGIDGISLTIGEVDSNSFCVNLIPETLQRTNLGGRQQGEHVNIEIDPQTQAIVETVERVLTQQKLTTD